MYPAGLVVWVTISRNENISSNIKYLHNIVIRNNKIKLP